MSHIWRVEVASGETVQLTNGEKGESGPRWSPDGHQIAFIAERGDDEEAQIYLLSNRGGEAAPRSKAFSTNPLDYEAGRRYPLVVQTHGGPASSDKFGFGRWSSYVHVLAAKGYMVLKPNYRGSTG